MQENFLLYGSGGHAKVVLECLLSGQKNVAGMFDDNPSLVNFKSIHVFGKYNLDLYPKYKLIITIGNNKIRKKIAETVLHQFGIARHETSLCSTSAKIGEGSMLIHRSIVQSDASIGKHVIINTNAVVEHDCIIEDFVHIAPGAIVCGNSEIGEGTLVGANSVIAPNVKVGKWCQISAGSSVLEDVPDFGTVKGVPGQLIK